MTFLSQSHQADMACPHGYAVKWIEKKQQAPNEFNVRGREIHDICAKQVKYLVKHRLREDEAHLRHLVHESGCLPDAAKILRRMNGTLTIDPDAVLDVEVRLFLDGQFKPCESHFEHIAYAGTLDLIESRNSEGLIRDYKSHYNIVSADTFQGLLYSAMAMTYFDHLDAVTFELAFVRYGATRSVRYERKKLPEMTEEIATHRRRQLRIHKQYEQGGIDSLEAMPSNSCVYCPLLHHGCPIDNINPFANPTPQERVRWGLKMQIAERENRRILQEIVKVSGPIEVTDDNGKRYAAQFVEQEESGLPLRTVYPHLESWEDGHPNDRIIDKCYIGATELKPLLEAKKRAPLAEVIAPCVEMNTKTVFKISGVNNDSMENNY